MNPHLTVRGWNRNMPFYNTLHEYGVISSNYESQDNYQVYYFTLVFANEEYLSAFLIEFGEYMEVCQDE